MIGIDFRHVASRTEQMFRSQGPALGLHPVGEDGDVGTVKVLPIPVVFDGPVEEIELGDPTVAGVDA